LFKCQLITFFQSLDHHRFIPNRVAAVQFSATLMPSFTRQLQRAPAAPID
jgi:hypothetical protein